MERLGGLPVVYRYSCRARRYLLRLTREGEIVVTLPPGGNKRTAAAFLERSREWIARQQSTRASATGHAQHWRAGDRLLWRGERVALAVGFERARPFASWGDQRIFIADAGMNLRRPLEARMLQVAREELPKYGAARARELGVPITRVSVRNQRSRWGSCSSNGVISLNWRLVQTPEWVVDYLIVHELMHRREMNHSARFWRHVEQACPRWREAEAWLDAHARELGF